jgi:hypothetical protein
MLSQRLVAGGVTGVTVTAIYLNDHVQVVLQPAAALTQVQLGWHHLGCEYRDEQIAMVMSLIRL